MRDIADGEGDVKGAGEKHLPQHRGFSAQSNGEVALYKALSEEGTVPRDHRSHGSRFGGYDPEMPKAMEPLWEKDRLPLDALHRRITADRSNAVRNIRLCMPG
jgi:hypothetical protein